MMIIIKGVYGLVKLKSIKMYTQGETDHWCAAHRDRTKFVRHP